jgi:hypothetical protein
MQAHSTVKQIRGDCSHGHRLCRLENVATKACVSNPICRFHNAGFVLATLHSRHRATATKGQRQLSVGSAYLSATAARRGQTVCCRSEGSTVSPHISPCPPRMFLQRLSALSTRCSRQSRLHSRQASTLHTVVKLSGDVCSHATTRLIHVDLRDSKTRDLS